MQSFETIYLLLHACISCGGVLHWLCLDLSAYAFLSPHPPYPNSYLGEK